MVSLSVTCTKYMDEYFPHSCIKMSITHGKKNHGTYIQATIEASYHRTIARMVIRVADFKGFLWEHKCQSNNVIMQTLYRNAHDIHRAVPLELQLLEAEKRSLV